MQGPVLGNEWIATLSKGERNYTAILGATHGQKLISHLIGAVGIHLQWTSSVLDIFL